GELERRGVGDGRHLLRFDHGLVIADTLARIREPSPKGFKEALERLRMQPACVGAPGNVISFGAHDNRGYKGQYIVMRTIKNGLEQLVDVDLGALLPVEPRRIGFEDAAAKSAQVSSNSVGKRTPHRIGVLQDWALWAPVKDWYNGLTLAFEEAYECGILDRPVELVVREIEGPPDGEAAKVIKAWRELAHKEHCLAIVGPHITDMAIIMRDVVEAEKVPTIAYTATFKFAGDYCFQTPNGTFADETFLISNHLAKRGVKSVGVIREDNPIGDEYFGYFRQHVRRLGIAVSSDQIVSPRIDTAGALTALEAIRASGGQAVAHLGYGLSFWSVLEAAQTMVQRGWDTPRATITTWVGATGLSEKRGSPQLMNLPMPIELLEGWVGVDLPHEGNAVFTSFMQRYVKRFGGDRPFNCYPAHMYDIGRVLAEAIARSRPVTPKGLKRGLEQVRMVPATMGGPGTVLSFAPSDHRGYKGPDYLVLRGVRNGVEGLAESLFDFGR
ncbi:MAG: ABC transporter substrate-binding protein, partial [Caulobacteraceae bacterium]|nr:ABC transporter substrate-binding protein [Caulobacteraceae bacterium]